MANAKLHVICGNCGSSDDIELNIERDFNDHGDGTFSDEASLTCKNCSTIHFLSSEAERQGWDDKTPTRIHEIL